jgi:hypothetical protein
MNISLRISPGWDGGKFLCNIFFILMIVQIFNIKYIRRFESKNDSVITCYGKRPEAYQPSEKPMSPKCKRIRLKWVNGSAGRRA